MCVCVFFCGQKCARILCFFFLSFVEKLNVEITNNMQRFTGIASDFRLVIKEKNGPKKKTSNRVRVLCGSSIYVSRCVKYQFTEIYRRYIDGIERRTFGWIGIRLFSLKGRGCLVFAKMENVGTLDFFDYQKKNDNKKISLFLL